MGHSSELSHKIVKRFLTNVHGKLSDNFLAHYAHFWVPGINISKDPQVDNWDAENVMRLHQEFPYCCDFPKPLLPPAKIRDDVLNDNGDPALQLLAIKAEINDDVETILDYYERHKKTLTEHPHKKNIKWKKEKKTETTMLPRYVAELAEILEMDPDPYFKGKYNWYHTGGSLARVVMGGENLLIFPYADDLIATRLDSLPNSMWKPNLRTAAKCEIDETIYELRANVQNASSRILGRCKNHCVFYSVSEIRGKLQMLQVHKESSKVPLIGADLDAMNYNKFCTMNVERTVTLWDMVSCKKIGSNTIDASKVLEDKWGSVRFMKSDPSTLVLADRCCLHYLDTRAPFERPVLSLCPKVELQSCESLCLESPSRRSEDHSYVGTYHSLFMCDRRSPEDCVQQKWTHQFKSPPLLVGVHTRGEQEVIVLSSQLSSETTIILNTWDDCVPQSYNLPHTPPSILDTLNESQMQGKCLDPQLKKRLKLSNAGISLAVDNNGDLSLFLQNSIGDVFYQGITHQEALDKFSHVNCQSYKVMEAWEKRILMEDRLIKPLVITERTNMQHVFENLTNKNLVLERDIEPPELLRNPEWKQSRDKLKEYVDILGAECFAMWEVTEDNIPVVQPAVPHQKVLSWLTEMPSQKDPVQSQELRECTPPVFRQELYSVSQQQSQQRQQQPELIDITEDVPLEFYFPPVRVTTTSRKSPKKKKPLYVEGF